MENLDPPPPKSKMGKWRVFCPSRGFILDLGGDVGLLFHFILSKIVAEILVHQTLSANSPGTMFDVCERSVSLVPRRCCSHYTRY